MNREREEALRNFIRRMMTATSAAGLYSPRHPQVKNLCLRALADLRRAAGPRPEISLLVIGEELIHEGSPLEGTLSISRFARVLAGRGIGSIRIGRDLSWEEMKGFLAALAEKGEAKEAVCSSPNLHLGKLEAPCAVARPCGMGPGGNPQALPVPLLCGGATDKLKEIYAEIREQGKLRVIGVREIVAGLVRSIRRDFTPFWALTPLRSADEYTFTHSLNICLLNLAQAMGLGLSGQLLHDIGIAAMLHDVGKCFLPPDLLRKEGKLAEEEWALMQQHPVRGAEYLLRTGGIPPLAVIVAFEHHVRFNRQGYPPVPPGWRLNLCSQMTAISDFFDALHTRRSYRPPLEVEEIAATMRSLAGTELHPVLTENFLQIYSYFSWARRSKSNESCEL